MRRNLRLDWRALALLGALLSFIIAWRGLVSAMPLMAMDNNLTDSSGSTYSSTSRSKYNSTNNSNLFSNSYLQSDHSRSSLVPSAAEDSDQLEEPLGFVISAMPSEHLAVLSRTERSIRHQNQQQQKKHHHHHQQQQQQPMSPADNNFIGSKSKRLSNPRSSLNINSSSSNTPISNLDRNERSTVPQSHLAWTSRKIQLYIKNRILQILRDGVVNGTQDENSEFTILQRSTVDVGRIKLQSVATCLYLCMDACGVPYGSKDFTDDCVFNENMGLQNYNTYSSTYHSQARRVFYLALNGSGQPRRTQIPASRSLGKLSTYTNAITETVPQERVEQLIAKNFGANRVKHGVRQLCDTGKPLIELIDGPRRRDARSCGKKAAAEKRAPPNCGKKKWGQEESYRGRPKAVQQRPKGNIQHGGKKKPNKAGKQRQNGGKKQQQHQLQQQQQQPLQHQAKSISGGKRKHRKLDASTTTTMATSLATPPSSHWESSSPLPAFSLSETSDRVERNVRMSSDEEQDQDNDQDQEQSDPAEQGEEEAEGDVGSLEDASYEDASSEAQGRSGAGGDDSLYYDFLCLQLIALVLLRKRAIL
ncbi:GM26894 [Drosophila sechellia]|uniref:Fibroblast growth factor n=1 Tax=Drosophila sechellia TaxID=7238 RepID=B4IHS2_DROSE|nr:GM26894 [Drosophila sechellia]